MIIDDDDICININKTSDARRHQSLLVIHRGRELSVSNPIVEVMPRLLLVLLGGMRTRFVLIASWT
jgi:hypothetical protein